MAKFCSATLAVFLCTLAGTMACGPVHVTLTYPPSSPPTHHRSDPDPAKALPNANGAAITLLPFRDSRANPALVGEVLNGYGMKVYDVLAENNVAEWFNQALQSELEKMGFQVNAVAQPSPTFSGLVLRGEILGVYGTEGSFDLGLVTFRAVVAKNGKEFLNQDYTGKSRKFAADEFEESLAEALAKAIAELGPDLVYYAKTN